MNVRRPFTFDRVFRLFLVAAAVAIVVWLIYILRGVLLPFAVSWLIAYMLEPFVQFNRRLLQLRGRAIAVFITLFETLLVLAMLGVVLMPAVVDELHQMSHLTREYANSGADIPFLPDGVHDFLRRIIDFNTIADMMRRQGFANTMSALTDILSGGLDVLLAVFNWLMVLLYVIFIMLDYEYLIRGVRRMVPPKYREVVFSIGNDVKESMNRYFRGQALVSLCVGILFSIGFAIIGLPLAVVLGLFIGVLNMVPYLQLVSIIPTTLLCLVASMDGSVDFWPKWWECIAVYTIVQCIQDLILTPRIMGKAMGLNPAVILLSLSVWGTLLGFIGLIIALPLTTLLISWYNRFISRAEENSGEPPTPTEGTDDSPDSSDAPGTPITDTPVTNTDPQPQAPSGEL